MARGVPAAMPLPDKPARSPGASEPAQIITGKQMPLGVMPALAPTALTTAKASSDHSRRCDMPRPPERL